MHRSLRQAAFCKAAGVHTLPSLRRITATHSHLRAAADRRSQSLVQESLPDAGVIIRAVAASLVALSFAAKANAAEAEASWKPRRHHRHIGERFTDTWADAIVEREEATVEQIRELQRQLRQEKKRADDEASKRREVEQKLRTVILDQRNSKPTYDDEGFLAIRVAGADVTGPLLFLALMGGGYYAYVTDLYGRITGKTRAGAKGKWVYDRSLGGKKIWVEEKELPPHMSESDFNALTTIAAKSSAKRGSGAPFQPPSWWQAPTNYPTSSITKDQMQLEASRLLTRVEQAKNRGEDYKLEDILTLRKACAAGGGVTVDTRTVGGRDAIFRAAVEAGIKSAQEPGSVDLGGETPLRLAAGLAGDLQIPDERAITMLTGWVAGACRTKIVDAIAALKEGNDANALMMLAKLSATLDSLPVLEPDSANVELIADELEGWAEPSLRARVLELAGQVDPKKRALVAAMVGLPEATVSQQQQQQQQAGAES